MDFGRVSGTLYQDPVIWSGQCGVLRSHNQASAITPRTWIHDHDKCRALRKVRATLCKKKRRTTNVMRRNFVRQVNNTQVRVHRGNGALHDTNIRIGDTEVCEQDNQPIGL